jgi:hypothetical protein
MGKNCGNIGKTLLLFGVGAVCGYVKCMSDIADQNGEVEVKPTKHSTVRMSKRKEEKES